MAEGERLFEESLRENEYFQLDLRQVFDAPTELLRTVADRTKVYPYKSLSEVDTEDLADRFGMQSERIQRLAGTFLFLKATLIDKGQEPMALIAESRALLDQDDLARGRENEFSDIFSYTERDQEEAIALRAFSQGHAFVSARFVPCLLPAAPSSAELVGGYLWTISHVGTQGDQHSITIGITPGELEQLENTIAQAKEQLRTMRDSINSPRTEEG